MSNEEVTKKLMSDEELLKAIVESKANQKVRDHINEGVELGNSIEEQQALEKYNAMTESEQQQFMQKGWKNG